MKTNDTRRQLVDDLSAPEADNDDYDEAIDEFLHTEGNGYGFYEKDAVALLRTAANNLDYTLADALTILTVADIQQLLEQKRRRA